MSENIENVTEETEAVETVEESITVAKLKAKYPALVIDVIEEFDELTVIVNDEGIKDICRFLRDDPELKYNFLADVTAIDMGVDAHPRFISVYHLLSHEFKHRVRIKAPVSDSENPEIDSVVGIWGTADWHERETYDLFGINYLGHPDLRRILLPDHWESFPLRKDYPLKGQNEPLEPISEE